MNWRFVQLIVVLEKNFELTPSHTKPLVCKPNPDLPTFGRRAQPHNFDASTLRCFDASRTSASAASAASAVTAVSAASAASITSNSKLRTLNFKLRTCPLSAGHKQSRRANNFELISSLPFAHFLIVLAKSISLAAVGKYLCCYHFPTHRFVVVCHWYC